MYIPSWASQKLFIATKKNATVGGFIWTVKGIIHQLKKNFGECRGKEVRRESCDDADVNVRITIFLRRLNCYPLLTKLEKWGKQQGYKLRNFIICNHLNCVNSNQNNQSCSYWSRTLAFALSGFCRPSSCCSGKGAETNLYWGVYGEGKPMKTHSGHTLLYCYEGCVRN